MSQDFSGVHGTNVTVSPNGQQVNWAVNEHTGLCVVNKPLNKGDILELVIDGDTSGGGHVHVGVTDCSDEEIKRSNMQKTILGGLPSKWTKIRVKGNKAHYKIEREMNSRFLVTLENKTTAIDVDAKRTYRFTADILFGKIQVIIKGSSSRKFKWDKALCGDNVYVSEDSTMVCLLDNNPNAYCALERPLTHQDPIKLNIAPTDDAKWTYLVMYASSISPSKSEIDTCNFRYQDSQEFMPLIRLKNVTKEVILWLEDDRVLCQAGTPDNLIEISGLTKNKIYVYFEIFRLVMTAVEVKTGEKEWPVYTTVTGMSDHKYYEINEIPDVYIKDNRKPVENDETKGTEILGRMKNIVKKKSNSSQVCDQVQYYINRLNKAVQLAEDEYAYLTPIVPPTDVSPSPASKPVTPKHCTQCDQVLVAVAMPPLLPKGEIHSPVDKDELIKQIEVLKKQMDNIEKKKCCSIVAKKRDVDLNIKLILSNN